MHLQCHTGMDTLSWLRAGARTVTGVDFSPVAVAKAVHTAAAAGFADRARFVEADVLAVPAELHGRFDVCFASPDAGRGIAGPDEDGRYRWRRDGELLPILYSLRAARR